MFFRILPSTREPSDGPRPYFIKSRSSELFILTSVSIAIFTDIFLYAVIVPVIPFALQERADIAIDNVQSWVSILLACYAAGLLVFAPIWGWVADHTESRLIPFTSGLIVLIAATALMCVGNSIGLIVAGRLLQGISSGLVWSVGLAIVSDTVGATRAGEAMGWVSLSMVFALFLGPLLGGVTFEGGGYYATYGMCFGLLGLDCVLRFAMIEKRWARHYGLDDKPSAEETSVESVEKAESNDQAVTNQQTVTDQPEAQVDSPQPAVKPLKFSILALVRIPRMLAALWACLVHGVLLSSFDAVLPLFTSRTFGWNSLGGGLIFIAICIPSFAEPLVGWLADRWGPRYLATTGLIFAMPFYVLLRFVDHNTLEQKVLLCALLALIGANVSLILPPMMAEITRVVVLAEQRNPGLFGEKGAFAQAFALFNMAYAGGILVGPIWGGYVIDGSGWGTLGWSLGLLSFVSALPAFLYAGGEFWKRRRE